MNKANQIKLNVLGFSILGCLTAGTYGMASNDSIGGNIHFEVKAAEPTPTPKPLPTFATERHAYVYEVFGDDYDKAILVLQGVKDLNGNVLCGGENYNIRPEAVNVNHHKDGSISRDFGPFQINDRFHPVYELNLDTDWKANIRYAKRMFDNDGGTFSKRWVAGMCLRDMGYDI